MFSVLQQQVAQPHQPAPVAPTPPPSIADLPDDDYVSGKQVREYVNRLAQTAMAPQLEQASALGASAAVGLLQREHTEDFRRWGPEIHSLIAGIPANQRTLDNLERVVKYVRSEHLSELLADQERELRQRLQSEMVSPGLRSNGAPGAGPVPTNTTELSLANEGIPAAWRKQAAEAGITEHVIDEFLRANEGMTREGFFQMLTKGGVMTDKAVLRG